ncbi:F-box only protein 25 [Liparis tanakae]|uniref:F-box only protein 25 n=1 Tax=Liparis tanakae TaxID=230148 RepID=A0A4Z2HUE2_9TELE|nr:F-box only protein 25 [Liparis tanakae]
MFLYGHELEDNREIDLKGLCNDNLFVGDVCELATRKSKKDLLNNNTKSQFIFVDKWIYVHNRSTKELFQLIARTQLTCLSGAAQKNYFNILEKIVRKDDHYNPRLVKDLLQDLSLTLHNLTIHVGRCVLVGNVNIWLCRLETIHKWKKQVNNLQIPEQICNGMTFDDLPIHMQNKILCELSDACDIINVGQAMPTMHGLSEDRILWRKLCHFHFSDKQFGRNLVLSNSEKVDWKLMYFTLKKHYPMKEQYGDTLHFCKNCNILFWKDCGHPCTANDPDSCLVPISPQHFIDLFKF